MCMTRDPSALYRFPTKDGCSSTLRYSLFPGVSLLKPCPSSRPRFRSVRGTQCSSPGTSGLPPVTEPLSQCPSDLFLRSDDPSSSSLPLSCLRPRLNRVDGSSRLTVSKVDTGTYFPHYRRLLWSIPLRNGGSGKTLIRESMRHSSVSWLSDSGLT